MSEEKSVESPKDDRTLGERITDKLKSQAKVEVQELFSGLSRMVNEVSDELKYQAVFGAHETAAALFRGDAFVMYPKNEGNEQQENAGHGLHGQAMEQNENGRDGR